MEGGLIRGCATIWNADVHATRSTALHRCMIRVFRARSRWTSAVAGALQEHKSVVSKKASQNTQKVRNSDVYGFIRDGFTPLCSRHQPPNTRKLLAPRGEAQAPKRWSPATPTAARRPNTGKNERPTLHGANRRRHPTQRRAAPWSLTRVNTSTAAPLTASDRRELLPDSSPLHLLLRPASPPPIRQAR